MGIWGGTPLEPHWDGFPGRRILGTLPIKGDVQFGGEGVEKPHLGGSGLIIFKEKGGSNLGFGKTGSSERVFKSGVLNTWD